MSTAEQEQQAKDYYANVRTNVGSVLCSKVNLLKRSKVLLAWALSNVSGFVLMMD